MSIYARYGGTVEHQLATNRGYGDVVRWVQSIPDSVKVDHLRHLVDWGWVNEASELSGEITSAMRAVVPESSVKKTLDSFVGHLADSTAESVMITNGLSTDDDVDGEWWIDGKPVTEGDGE